MNVRKPVRVLESRISIRQSTVKPWRSRMPQPTVFFAAPVASVPTGVRVSATRASTAAAATSAADAKPDHRRLPRDSGQQQQRDDRAERKLADVAGEVVGAQRRTTSFERDKRARSGSSRADAVPPSRARPRTARRGSPKSRAHSPSPRNATPTSSVPSASRLRSPKRSAKSPAGIWNAAIAARCAPRMTPTCASDRPKVCARSGSST